jgi:hypothetical protein
MGRIQVPDKSVPLVDPNTGIVDARWFSNVFKKLEGNAAADPGLGMSHIVVGEPADGDKGDGSINAEEIYEDGKRVFVQAGNADAGVTYTPCDHGVVSGGSITPDPSSGPKQVVVNNGAFQINATAEIGDLELRIINGSSAGSVTFSGFSKKWPSDTMATTDGNEYAVFIFGYGSKIAYLIKALQ